MQTRTLGSLLLLGGFLAGAWTVVARVDSVPRGAYGAALATMAAAAVVLHRDRRRRLDSDHHEGNVRVLADALAMATERVSRLAALREDAQLLLVHRRIDDEVLEALETFADGRESLVPVIGLEGFAEVMGPFATGERLLNRAWSASADGYVDEVRRCLRLAVAEFERARRELGRRAGRLLAAGGAA